MQKFEDGLKDLNRKMVSERTTPDNHQITITSLDVQALAQLSAHPLLNKICKLKTSYMLQPDNFVTDSSNADALLRVILDELKQVIFYMYALGRGCLILCYNQIGEDLKKPFRLRDGKQLRIIPISADSIQCYGNILDLVDPRFGKPEYYSFNGQEIHPSRVIDFTYILTTFQENMQRQFRGISLTELLYEQLIHDEKINRAGTHLVEKSSTFVYGMSGYNDSLMKRQEDVIISKISTAETSRSIYNALLVDKEDNITAVSQALNGFTDIADNSLRRIAMLSDVPLALLIGESAQGLNSTGASELRLFFNSIANDLDQYIMPRLVDLFDMLEMGKISRNPTINETAIDKATFESIIIKNALDLSAIGEDATEYLEFYNIVKPTDNPREFAYEAIEADKTYQQNFGSSI